MKMNFWDIDFPVNILELIETGRLYNCLQLFIITKFLTKLDNNFSI